MRSTFAIAASALTAVASATSAASSFNLNSTCDEAIPYVRVINNCAYDLYALSVLKGEGCPDEDGAVIAPGDFYQENYRTDTTTGVAIKLSRSPGCNNPTQLEYFIQESGAYAGNYPDLSYVNANSQSPTRQEGYYLKAGTLELECDSEATCNECSYVNPDDVQTKYAPKSANMEFYACGKSSSGGSYSGGSSSASPAASSQAAASSKAAAPSSQAASYQQPSSAAAYQPATSAAAYAEAVTAAPSADDSNKHVNVKTEVVYVTATAYAKRHEHAHRHPHFRA